MNPNESNEPRYLVSDEPRSPLVKTFSQLEWKDIDNLIRYDHELHQWVPLAPEVKQQVREQKVENNMGEEIKVYQIKNPNGEVSHKTFLNLEQEDVEGLGFWNNVLRSWVPYDEFKKDEIRKRLFERDHPNYKPLHRPSNLIRQVSRNAVENYFSGKILRKEHREGPIQTHTEGANISRRCKHGVSIWEPCPNCDQPEEDILTPEEVKEIFSTYPHDSRRELFDSLNKIPIDETRLVQIADDQNVWLHFVQSSKDGAYFLKAYGPMVNGFGVDNGPPMPVTGEKVYIPGKGFLVDDSGKIDTEIFIEGADVLKGDLSIPTSKGFGMLSSEEFDKLENEGICSNCNGFGVMRDKYSAEIKSCPVCMEVKEKGNELQLPKPNTTPPEESWRDRPPML